MTTTAYERDRNALLSRIDQLERKHDRLEREVDRLKAWTRPPTEMCLKCGAGFGTPNQADEPCVHGGA